MKRRTLGLWVASLVVTPWARANAPAPYFAFLDEYSYYACKGAGGE